MRWWDPANIDRLRLAKAARRYAEQGWPVVPGAYLVARRLGRHAVRRFDCGEPGCRTVACHPAVAHWETSASYHLETVDSWWRLRPYSVLLATGHAFDVLEVPAVLGRAALLGDGFVAARGPVAVAPGDRWMFLVRPGHELLPELATQSDVILHGLGSWVPAPPSQQFGGRVQWELPPETHHWRPADSYRVQTLMLDALGIGLPGHRPHRTAWRSMSWAS
jgi:Bifunctional DNA primase/polymerase, N-terminal